MPLKKLGSGQGYLKGGFLGFPGTGKTFTSCLLAAAVRKRFGLKGPIALIDSENATEYVAPLIKQLTGEDLVGDRTRDFNSLVPLGEECVKEGISVLVADSVTHWWRNLCDSYLSGVNESRRRKNQPPRTRLEFQDWQPIKALWGNWTTFYLNSPLHIIIAGRAGYEYDMGVNEDTGRKELEKTGIKMKTESEFGFEPSLLVQMDMSQSPAGDGKFKQTRTATVLKDRFAVIDGYEFVFPKLENRQLEMDAVAAAFGPHIEMLTFGAHSTVATSVTPMDASEEGDVDWSREKKARTILAEEIQGAIVSQIPGQSADDKKKKADLLQQVFGTRSWTAVENMRSDHLRECLAALKKVLGIEDSPQEAPKVEDDPSLGPVKAPAPEPPIPQNVGMANAIRLLLTSQKPKIPESVLLGYLAETACIPKTIVALEAVPQTVMDMVSRDWSIISTKIQEARAAK